MVLWNKDLLLFPVCLPRAPRIPFYFRYDVLVGPNYSTVISLFRANGNLICAPVINSPVPDQPVSGHREHKEKRESWKYLLERTRHGKPDTVIITHFTSYCQTLNYDRDHLYFQFLLSFGSLSQRPTSLSPGLSSNRTLPPFHQWTSAQ